MTTAEHLKSRHRLCREQQSVNLSTRIHRSISWLAKAESEVDMDGKFVFLWISFNAAYAHDFSEELQTRHQFKEFLEKLIALDTQSSLHHLLFSEFNGVIRTLISNEYIYAPFWTAVRSHDSSNEWKESHRQSIKLATAALLNKDTLTVLMVVFDRLYVLRNQLMHGGATWQSSVNRQQVIDGTKILGKLVPNILSIMIDSKSVEFGEIMYPVI
jgi:hypothetical protein